MNQVSEKLTRAIVIAKGETRHGRKTPMLFAARNIYKASRLVKCQHIGLYPISNAAKALERAKNRWL